LRNLHQETVLKHIKEVVIYTMYYVFSSDLLSIPILPAPESKPHELPFAHETTANGRSHNASHRFSSVIAESE
jgi:hypothetical protein